jgi:lipopolysaccharide transport system ATP-binding protein
MLSERLGGHLRHLYSRLAGRDEKAPSAQNHPREQTQEIWALKDVSFEVQSGEAVGIIGRNGAGKSTLLKILSRITEPTSGRVKLQGRVSSLLEVGTGFHPELTGRENIFLNGAILGMAKDEIRRKFDEIVGFAEIEKFIDTPVKRYSSGMYVRLAFAVAAHLEPEVLVVDEVLAVGDSQFQRKCLGKMGDIGKEGRTVLLVSHNMAAIQKLCPKTVWLENGQLNNFADTQSVVSSYLNEISEETITLNGLPPGFIYIKEPSALENQFGITGIQLLDRERRPTVDIGTWDYVCFRILYHSNRDLKRAAIELKIQTQDGVPLILASTEPDSTIPLIIKAGSGCAECIIPRLPLSEGTYFVGAGITIPWIEYLSWDNYLGQLKVTKRDIFKSGLPPSSNRYFVATDVEWRIPEND